KPRQEQKASLTVQKIQLGATTRPSFSSISMKATQTTLQLKVPSKQIRYIFPDMNDTWMFWADLGLALTVSWACVVLVLMPVFATPLTIFLITLLLVVIIFIRLKPSFQDPSPALRLGKLFVSAKRLRKTSANVTLQKKDREVVVTLNLLKGVGKTVIYQEKLIGISAGAETLTRYRLNLNFPSDDQMIIVNGDRREIEWLCNELSEWAGIQARPWPL
ncbi:MAG: hypothetical protein WBA43_04310, partial [Elainellaceae cyanobacterium]